jgi:hypothetical protein
MPVAACGVVVGTATCPRQVPLEKYGGSMNTIDTLVLRLLTLAEVVLVVLALLGQALPLGTLCPQVWPQVWLRVLEVITALRWAVM